MNTIRKSTFKLVCLLFPFLALANVGALRAAEQGESGGQLPPARIERPPSRDNCFVHFLKYKMNTVTSTALVVSGVIVDTVSPVLRACGGISLEALICMEVAGSSIWALGSLACYYKNRARVEILENRITSVEEGSHSSSIGHRARVEILENRITSVEEGSGSSSVELCG